MKKLQSNSKLKLPEKIVIPNDRPPMMVPVESEEAIVEALGTTDWVLAQRLINQVYESLWLPDGLSDHEKSERLQAAVTILRGIKPEGELEGMLATQMVATHTAAMECLRRSMILEQSIQGRESNLRHAAKLLSVFAKQLEALNRNRGKGQQKVTVEHVHVQSGGQAIVGNVAK